MSGGFFINKLGRKGTMMYNSVFFALSYLCLAAAQNVWMLFVGRFLSGMASGKDLLRYGRNIIPNLIL
jgi:predicted MFS family arabinose efflux permease